MILKRSASTVIKFETCMDSSVDDTAAAGGAMHAVALLLYGGTSVIPGRCR